MAERCGCHDFLLADCTTTRAAAARAADDQRAYSEFCERLLKAARVVPAGFPGVCASCSEPFPVDTPIKAFHLKPDGTVEPSWVAACCLDERGALVP